MRFLDDNIDRGYTYLFNRAIPQDQGKDIRYAIEGNLKKILEIAPKSSNYSDREIILRGLYDEIWGIHNHEQDENLLSLSLMHPTEALYGENTVLEKRLKTYIEVGILEYTGLSFNEYLDLPRHYQEIYNRVCQEKKKVKDKKMGDLTKEFEKLQQM